MPKNQEPKESKGKLDIKKYKKVFLIVTITVLVVLLSEIFFNRDIIRLDKSQRGYQTFPLENLGGDGFEYTDGKLVKKEELGFINISCPDTYINRLKYKYNVDGYCVASVLASKDILVNIDESFFSNRDTNDKFLDGSAVLIKDNVSSLLLGFGDENKKLEITEIGYENIFRFSWRRMVAIGLFVATILTVILYADLFKDRIENGFLIIAISVCLSMLLTLPAKKMSWDEEYHFSHSYKLGFGNEVVVSPEVNYYFQATPILFYPKTSEEYMSIDSKMKHSDIYNHEAAENKIQKTGFHKLSDIGHIASAIGIKIGRLLHLPFNIVYMLGKLFNAMLYIIVTYLAIRHIKVGKRMLTAIALMPTPLFLASTYSYDATINAFAFLGFSYIFSELAEPEKKISWKSFFIFMISVFIATSVKMVYAPLLLFLLTLPNEKFENKRQKYIMKYGVFILCFIVLVIMLMPVLVNPPTTGDSRGGATSYKGQMEYILSNPIRFARMIGTLLFEFGITHVYSESMMTSFAHYDGIALGGYLAFFMAFVMLTDSSERRIVAKTKAFMAVIIILIICFIWSAMYISFTPVGSGTVNGVQGRYFLPLSLPSCLIINSSYVKCNITAKTYNKIILIVPLLFSSYMLVLDAIKYCA